MKVVRKSFSHRGFELSYLDSAPGDGDRPVVLLLHGFPDQAVMWEPQIKALHAAGFRCLAPDTLGCGQSEIAPRVADYNAVKVVGDHAALLDSLEIERVHVVGHDWGAVFAWYFAAYFPGYTNKLVVMSVGHPTAYGRAGMKQKLRGWYTLYFQLRGLAEALLVRDGLLSLRKLFLRSHPHREEILQRVREPGRLTAALAPYRANLLSTLFRRQPNVSAPTLGIWTDGDDFLTEDQMQASERYVDGPWRYERLSGHHWMSLEQPERINHLLLEHLA